MILRQHCKPGSGQVACNGTHLAASSGIKRGVVTGGRQSPLPLGIVRPARLSCRKPQQWPGSSASAIGAIGPHQEVRICPCQEPAYHRTRQHVAAAAHTASHCMHEPPRPASRSHALNPIRTTPHAAPACNIMAIPRRTQTSCQQQLLRLAPPQPAASPSQRRQPAGAITQGMTRGAWDMTHQQQRQQRRRSSGGGGSSGSGSTTCPERW